MKKLFILISIWSLNNVSAQAGPAQEDQKSAAPSTPAASPRVSEVTAFGETGYRHDEADSTGIWVFTDSGNYQLNAQLMDTTFLYVDYNGSAWLNNGKTLYSYNSQGNDTNSISQVWDSTSSQWVNSFQQLASFNNLGKQAFSVSRTWDTANMQWVNDNQYTSNYNGNGDDTNGVYQLWNAITSQWVNNYQDNYTYDNNHHELSDTYQRWDTSMDQWVNLSRYIYGYTASGLMDTDIGQNWSGSEWVGNYELFSFYNSKGLDTTDIEITWNAVTNQWVNYGKYVYTYDGSGNELSSAVDLWDIATNSFDDYTTLDLYAYNGNNLKIRQIHESWVPSDSAYVNALKDTFNFDASGNEVGSIDYKWDTSSGEWIITSQYSALFDNSNRVTYRLDEENYDTSKATFSFYDRYFYYYLDTAAGINELRNDLNASIFPNPATNEVNICFSLEQPAAIIMNIYDLNGRILLSESQNKDGGANKMTIGATEFASGFYTVELMNKATGKSSTLKLVKQ